MPNGLIDWLLDQTNLTPHGFCLLWEPGLIWTYAVSDIGIGLAYFTIPVALAVFSRRRRDLMFRPLLWMFVSFILLCGTSHWLDVLTLWIPAYGIEAVVKAATALCSLATAAALWRLIPTAIALPSHDQLREANAALQQSREHYRNSFQQSPVPLFTVDGNGTITGVSNSWLALLGYTHEDVAGRNIGEFRAPDSAKSVESDRQTLMRAGEVHDLERSFLHKNGRLIEALVSARLDEQGLAVCVLIDITARRRAERALETSRAEAARQAEAEAALRQANAVLEARVQAQQAQRETEARFRFATEAGRLGIWELDLQTRELTASAMCKDSFGHDPVAPFTYQQLQDTIYREDRDRLAAAIEQSRETGADLDGNFHVVRPNGAVGWVQLHAQVVGDGQGLRLAGISLDITQRVQTEERIRQSQRVEAVGRLTAGIAHDFNNVLQTLLGGLELAIDQAEGHPDLRADLEFALKAGQRGAKLTSHLLSFARQQVLLPAPVQIQPLLSELSRTLQRTLGADIVVKTEVADHLPDAFVDAAHLDSALLNLAINARDAMPDGGILLLRAAADGGQIIVSVVDNGSGMPPDVLAQACEPFFSTKGSNGSGLGLSMVHGFARQSGGELRMESTPGEGTCISLSLPVATVAVPLASAERNDPQSGHGRILLVDDQPDVGRVTAAFLRKAGFDVTVANDGEEAVDELARDATYSALVTDYAMPGMDGVDLVRKARLLRAGLPALLMTGYASAKCLEELPSDIVVLHKPFQRQDLVRRVKLLVEAEWGRELHHFGADGMM